MKILSYHSSSTENSGVSGGGDGLSLEHGLVMATFGVAAFLVLVGAAFGYVKWRKVQRFKVLDNNGEWRTSSTIEEKKAITLFYVEQGVHHLQRTAEPALKRTLTSIYDWAQGWWSV